MTPWGHTWLPEWRGFVAATGPLCYCGSYTLKQDIRWRWRCPKGHFGRVPV